MTVPFEELDAPLEALWAPLTYAELFQIGTMRNKV